MKKLITAAVVAISVVLFAVAWWQAQPYFYRLDKEANQDFATKARALALVGRPESFATEHFGTPDYVRHEPKQRGEAAYKVLVYTPGPALALWNSQCLIIVDQKTGLVTAWRINSD